MKFVILLSILIAVTSAEVHNQCKKTGLFALCFDDGPADNTNTLLKYLSEKKVMATFHLSTQNLADPGVQTTVKRIHSAGHLIGTRTEANWDLAKMSEDQLTSAVARQSNVLGQFLGYYPKLLRLPYGKVSGKIQSALESSGAIITTHNLESYDFTKDQGRIQSAFNLAMGLKSSGSASFISLQHDAVKSSVDAVPGIIDSIKKHGYNLVKLDECINAGDLRKNKTPLKGGKDSGPIPTLDGSNADIPDGDQGGNDGKDGKDGNLIGLSGAMPLYVPAGCFIGALLLLQLIL